MVDFCSLWWSGIKYRGDQERELLESGWDGLKGFSRLDGSVVLPSRQWAWKEGSFSGRKTVSPCLPLLSHTVLSKFLSLVTGCLHGQKKLPMVNALWGSLWLCPWVLGFANLAVAWQSGNQISLASADFSKPNITAEVSTDSCELTEMVITCSSHGGFPKPRISGTLNNMSVEWNARWVSESSLSPYNVTGKLVLNVTKDVNITCSVEYDGISKSSSLLLGMFYSCFL